MNLSQIGIIGLAIGLTLLSGLADAQGFIHAANTWIHGKIVWEECGTSLLGFGIGAVCYVLVVNFLEQAGIVSAEIQTMVWFIVAIVGVALLSGKFLHWQRNALINLSPS
ncbi:MAG: hypothetical protein M3Z24_08315 [Chloroflexota bacterium]|nr:hypothetical protein [Chloroflexota bacterium]